MNPSTWNTIFKDTKQKFLEEWCIDRLIYRTKVTIQKQFLEIHANDIFPISIETIHDKDDQYDYLVTESISRHYDIHEIDRLLREEWKSVVLYPPIDLVVNVIKACEPLAETVQEQLSELYYLIKEFTNTFYNFVNSIIQDDLDQLEKIKKILYLLLNVMVLSKHISWIDSSLKDLLWKEFIHHSCHFLLFHPPTSPPLSVIHPNPSHPSKYPILVHQSIAPIVKYNKSWISILVQAIHSNLVVQQVQLYNSNEPRLSV